MYKTEAAIKQRTANDFYKPPPQFLPKKPSQKPKAKEARCLVAGHIMELVRESYALCICGRQTNEEYQNNGDI